MIHRSDIPVCILFVFFNDTATTEIYTLSLHDALPIWVAGLQQQVVSDLPNPVPDGMTPEEQLSRIHDHTEEFFEERRRDRKSTRLNSSHANISYAVFCLKKKKNTMTT